MNFSQISLLARKSIGTVISRNISLSSGPKLIQISPWLAAEPLKKKKRLDPAIIKAREERRKKKMEKAIRKLEKSQKQLKPIDEVEISLDLLDQKANRNRPNLVTPQQIEEFELVKKEWSRQMLKQRTTDMEMLERISQSQLKALKQLRLESEELYQSAVRIDENLLPFTFEGPVDTPPIENYPSPDGEYADISKKWQ